MRYPKDVMRIILHYIDFQGLCILFSVYDFHMLSEIVNPPANIYLQKESISWMICGDPKRLCRDIIAPLVLDGSLHHIILLMRYGVPSDMICGVAEAYCCHRIYRLTKLLSSVTKSTESEPP